MDRYLLSKSISRIFEAPFLAIPTFIILNLVLDFNNFLFSETICLLFGTILPILIMVLWGKRKGIDIDYTVKETRHFPLLVATALYFLATFLLWEISASPLTIALMFCYASNTVIVFFINLKWKISVHSMGIAGPTTALMFINPWFFVLGLIGPIIMWSRLTLKKHTLGQVLAGSILGYISTAIQLYYLTGLMNFDISTNFYIILLIILGLILAPLLLSIFSYLNNKFDYNRNYLVICFGLIFILLLIFLSFFSLIPVLALIFSEIVSIIFLYFGTSK